MKKRFIILVMNMVIMALILSACNMGPDNSNLESELINKDKIIENLEKDISELENKIKDLENKNEENKDKDKDISNNFFINGIQVIELIKEKNMETLADYIHPSKGVRFSPYPYIEVEKDVTFSAEELTNIINSDEIFNWGNYDGSGEPIELSFSDYYDRFVYDVDFANPHQIGNNKILGLGNSIDNVAEVYKDAVFLEFYFAGLNEEYDGMDWRSLKLVFEKEDDIWYLVGIIHGEWTI